jgi:regulator of sigma E protease
LGGFVAFSSKKKKKNNITFDKAKLYERTLVILAGPFINFVFALLLIIAITSGTQYKIIPTVTHIQANSIAAEIGIREGDIVSAIDGVSILSVVEIDKSYKDKIIQKISVNRDGLPSIIDIPNKSINDLGLYFFPNKPNSVSVNGIINDMPAKAAGIVPGSIINRINDIEILSIEDAVSLIKSNANKEITITTLNNEQYKNYLVTPILQKNNGVLGMELKTTISYKDNIKAFKYNILEIIPHSIYRFYDVTLTIINAIKKIITGKISIDSLSGPISIANYSYESVNAGLISFLSFLIILNINVGLINLLPIPTLDGGHLLFYCIEFFTGKKVAGRKLLISQQLGVIFLLLLFLIAVYNDVLKL